MSGFLVPFVAIAKFAKWFWNDLTSDHSGGSATPHLRHSSHVDERTGNERLPEYDEDASLYYDLDEDDLGDDVLEENDPDEGLSRERRYYDSFTPS